MCPHTLKPSSDLYYAYTPYSNFISIIENMSAKECKVHLDDNDTLSPGYD